MNTFLWTYAIKDLFRQKTRTLFGILGITVSLLLLTSVSIITDSVSYNFIDFLTLDAGTQDMVLSKRPISTNDENFTGYFDFREIIPKIHNATNEIGNIVPRGYFRSEIFNGNETMVSNQNKMWICAIDIALEEEIKFGSFQNLNNNLNISNGLPVNQCIVSESYARTNQLNIGEKSIFSLNH